MNATGALLVIAALVSTPASAAPGVVWSAFRQATANSCVWETGSPETPDKMTVVANLTGRCAGAVPSWSKDRAVVSLPADVHDGSFTSFGYPKASLKPVQTARGKAEIWVIDLKATPPQATLLPTLPPGNFQRAGVTIEGRVLALTMVPLPETLKPETETVTKKDGSKVDTYKFQGHTYEFHADGEGIREVAFAYEWDGKSGWKEVETKPTTSGWDYAGMADVLEADQKIAWCAPPKRETASDSRDLDPAKDAPLIKSLPVKAPNGGKDGSWVLETHPGLGDVVTHFVQFEFVHRTGLALFRKPGAKDFTPLPDLGFTAGDLTRATRAGNRYLVASDGLGRRPRIYDLTTGALVFKADDRMSAAFCAGW